MVISTSRLSFLFVCFLLLHSSFGTDLHKIKVESNDLQLISSDGRDASTYTDYVRAVVSAAFLGHEHYGYDHQKMAQFVKKQLDGCKNEPDVVDVFDSDYVMEQHYKWQVLITDRPIGFASSASAAFTFAKGYFLKGVVVIVQKVGAGYTLRDKDAPVHSPAKECRIEMPEKTVQASSINDY